MMDIQLIQGDCLDKLSLMTNHSVDLTITSPPYNMNLRIRNGKHCSRQIVKELSTKYKNFNDNLSINEYFEFNKKVINELLRVSKLTFYNVQFLTGNKQALYRLIGEFSDNIKEFIIWDKINAEPAIGQGVLNSRFEVLLVLSNKEDAISRSFKRCNFGRGELQNLWEIKRGKNKSEFNRAVFPVNLAEKIITNFSNEGDVCMDSFMGTGSAGIAALNLNRKFIGIELDECCYNEAVNRIKLHSCRFDVLTKEINVA